MTGVIENLPMRVERRGRKVSACHPRLLVRKKGVEDFIAEDQCERQFLRVLPNVVGKFLGEPKRARGDASFQHLPVLASALQVFFGRRPSTVEEAIQLRLSLGRAKRGCVS